MTDIAQAWFDLRKLHAELGALYRRNSSDEYHKQLLWNAIEELEAQLREEGIDVA